MIQVLLSFFSVFGVFGLIGSSYWIGKKLVRRKEYIKTDKRIKYTKKEKYVYALPIK